MSRAVKGLVALSAAAALGALVLTPRRRPLFRGRPFVSVTASYLTTSYAESVIDDFDRIPSGPFYVLVDTYGGQVTAVAMMLKTLVERRAEITAVVPRLAFSGGTLIALCSQRIIAGPRAFFSPVDPQIRECAARELDESIVAQQYTAQVADWVDRLVRYQVEDVAKRGEIRSLLLGDRFPHGWPIAASELASAGLALQIDRGLA